jgi:hypothetical protein
MSESTAQVLAINTTLNHANGLILSKGSNLGLGGNRHELLPRLGPGIIAGVQNTVGLCRSLDVFSILVFAG